MVDPSRGIGALSQRLKETVRTAVWPASQKDILPQSQWKSIPETGERFTCISRPNAQLFLRHHLTGLTPSLSAELDIRARNVANQMDRINMYSAFGCFVNTIYLSDNAEEAHQAPGEITIDIWDPQYLDQLTHEAGHAVFYGKDPMDWRFIFYYSLGDQKWELLKDSSYYSPDYKALRNRFPSSRPFYARYGAPFIGHPEDNPSELFASAFTYFNNHPDRLLSRIIHPYTPKGQLK